MPPPTWSIHHPESGTHTKITWGDDERGTKKYEDLMKGHGPALRTFMAMIEETHNQGHPSWRLRGNRTIEQFRAEKIQEVATLTETPIIDSLPPEYIGKNCDVGIGRVPIIIKPKPDVPSQDPNWQPTTYLPEPRPYCIVCYSVEVPKLCTGCSSVRFCSTKCQKEHWKRGHKHNCRHIADFRREANAAA
ncbi:uncharacterized protein BDZ99DRAFT_474225 [Mytilinidion resinicola]|uniref:MYND-type domain-containing protein n=1 Tax=Mytilinidion resinicola TaxID=574789 RepID=A0A6A6YYS6_9PEZI|nr:uncharacterized protein BDZ99DRAFT_474225 [Mytilinidion resinicola]KAF2813593.1 hypothetical protein BDZ99DRAFT_474225 [Mytilinidion resinicola]